jgi:hypothetical protein
MKRFLFALVVAAFLVLMICCTITMVGHAFDRAAAHAEEQL